MNTLRKLHMSMVVATALLTTVGCAPENSAPEGSQSTELHFNFVGGGTGSDGTNNGSAPFDTCALVGPGETVVVAKATRDFQAEPWVPCDANRGYRTGYVWTDLEILRQAGPPAPATISRSVWFLGNADLSATDATQAGTTFLASLRPAGNDWVVMAAVQVEPSDANAVSASDASSARDMPITLANSWSQVAADANAALSNYSTECGDPGPTMGGARSMTNQEFDGYVHDSTIDDACVDGGLPSRDRDAGSMPNQNSDAGE